jgi:hypothetical protein
MTRIRLFQVNPESGMVECSPQALAIPEFKTLYLRDDSEGRVNAWLDLSAAYFMGSVNPDNLYKGFTKEEKIENIAADILGKRMEDLMQDEDFWRAVEKIMIIEESSVIASYVRTTINGLNKLQSYLRDTDLDERDPVSNKPIHDPKKYLSILQEASSTAKTLRDLEADLKSELEAESGDRIKGGGKDEYHF